MYLTLSSGFNPKFPPPIVKSDSCESVQGGAIKTFRALITDARLQMVAQNGGKLDASLYGYRDQITAGTIRSTADGALVVRVPNTFREDDQYPQQTSGLTPRSAEDSANSAHRPRSAYACVTGKITQTALD